MPELPEVEVVRRSLKKSIIGKKIKKVHIFNRNLRYKINNNFKTILKGQIIRTVKRKSKYLLIGLSNKYTILIHLGMTGKIFIFDKKKIKKTSFYYDNTIQKKHNHFCFEFSKSNKLIYNDVRKFGFVKLVKSNEIKTCSHLDFLGPEPLSKKFSKSYLFQEFAKTKKNVKNFLMDQKYVSGIGNIYANEILHVCSINPRKNTRNINIKDASNIIQKTKIILKNSITSGGSSIKDFTGISGKNGAFQQKFKVYAREGLKCKKKKCHGIIKKIYISKRSSFFCTICQNN